MENVDVKAEVISACKSARDIDVGGVVRELADYGARVYKWDCTQLPSDSTMEYVFVYARSTSSAPALGDRLKGWLCCYAFPLRTRWDITVSCNGGGGALGLLADWSYDCEYIDLSAWHSDRITQRVEYFYHEKRRR